MNDLYSILMWTGGIGAVVLTLFAIEIQNLKTENKTIMATLAETKASAEALNQAVTEMEARLNGKTLVADADLDPIKTAMDNAAAQAAKVGV